MIHIKRIYATPNSKDGYRVLVDRLWPRGVSKERAALDTWLKDVAPSPELRAWFDHDPEKFAEFTKRYTIELTNNPAMAELTQIAKQHNSVTLLYAAKDPHVNHARVLEKHLREL